MVGNSGFACAERGEAAFDRSAYMRAYSRKKPAAVRTLSAARPEDALPDGICRGCGLRGAHRTPADCISQLRDLLAEKG